MTSPYIPIPPNSDNEDDDVSMTEDEEPESSSGYPYVPVRTDTDTDEEEPEEELDTGNNSWEDNRAPPRQTARMRVAAPERVTLSPDNTISTPDRYQMNTENVFSWDLTLKTLKKWRNISLGRSHYEQGESSEQHEPLLDTTPIIVDRMLSHENRMDLLEDVIIRIPEPDAYDTIVDHVTSVEEEVIRLKREVERMTGQLEANRVTNRDMQSAIEDLRWKLQQTKLWELISFESKVYDAQTWEEKKKK